ncbi:DUF502 domain-containing protein [Aquincola sp. MAHUQ-54]|uniref:DUF502 domain-containing protein n=1 Tax=Aquincola agrisoli TaxID=3119538 RepID=A0AAW9QF34_9BURK
MTGQARPLFRVFVTGLLAALPLAATVAIFAWVINLLLGWVGPESAVGQLLVAIGFGLAGSEVFGYLFGLAIVAGAVFALGLLVEAGLQRGLAKLVNAVMLRIPVVSTVYDLVRKMVGLFTPGGSDGLKSMSPVWCHFGGPGGAAALALLGSPDAVTLGGKRYLAVLIPTSPVPVGGGLLYVPEEWVERADVGIDAVTSIYVSMGLTSSQHLGRG